MWLKLVTAGCGLGGLALLLLALPAASESSSLGSWSSQLYSLPAATRLLQEGGGGDGWSTEEVEDGMRVKRAGGGRSLSVSNPIDVLRNRLRLEMGRRQMVQQQQNREFLKTIGKRNTQLKRFLETLEDERDGDYPGAMSSSGGDWGEAS